MTYLFIPLARHQLDMFNGAVQERQPSILSQIPMTDFFANAFFSFLVYSLQPFPRAQSFVTHSIGKGPFNWWHLNLNQLDMMPDALLLPSAASNGRLS